MHHSVLRSSLFGLVLASASACQSHHDGGTAESGGNNSFAGSTSPAGATAAGSSGTGNGASTGGTAGSTGGASTGGASTGGSTALTTWTNVKIGGGGYVPGIIYHPTAPNLRYARTDIGGVYRWDNSLSRWTALNDGFSRAEGANAGAESLALDPSDPTKVYITTGQSISNGNGTLYASSDQGASWVSSPLPFPVGSNNPGRAIGERLVADPNMPSILYCASRTAGLWKRAADGTWSQLTSFSSKVLSSDEITAASGTVIGGEFVVFDTSTSNTGSATKSLYVGVAPDAYATAANLSSSLYRSTDGGSTWTAVPTPVAGAFIAHMVRAADGLFYVVFTGTSGPGSTGPASVYKFDGSIWTHLKDAPSQQAGFGGLSVQGSGVSTKITVGVTNTWGAYSGQTILYRSADSGSSWTEIGYSGGNASHTIAPGGPPSAQYWGWIDNAQIDPANADHVSYVFGGGIWSTSNAFSSPTPTWTFDTDGLEETVSLSLTAPPPGASYVLASGEGDVGSYIHTSLTSSPTREPVTSAAVGGGSNGTGIDIAWNNPAFVVTVGTVNSASVGSYSADSGATWTAFPTLPPVATNSGDESNVAVSADGANVVWGISGQIPYYSSDKGASWTATNLPPLASVGAGRAYHLAADRKNPKKVYAFDHGGAWWLSGTAKVYYSTDGGHTFSASSVTPTVHMYNASWLAANPFVEGDVWLVDGNNLYHSTDSGVTWTKLTTMATVGAEWTTSHGATLVSLGKPAAGAAFSAAVYLDGTVGGVEGLYRSDDAGVTWLRINDAAHQWGGVSRMTADVNIYGRVYIAGGGRGILYSN